MSTFTDIREIRSRLRKVIKNFDKVYYAPSDIWNIEGLTNSFNPLKRDCVALIQIYETWGVITSNTKVSLETQLNSPDRENWYIAFNLILLIKPYKVLKNGHNNSTNEINQGSSHNYS